MDLSSGRQTGLPPHPWGQSSVGHTQEGPQSLATGGKTSWGGSQPLSFHKQGNRGPGSGGELSTVRQQVSDNQGYSQVSSSCFQIISSPCLVRAHHWAVDAREVPGKRGSFLQS